MSEQDQKDVIAAGASEESAGAPPVPVDYNAGEINYFLQSLDFYRPLLKKLIASVPPTELVVLLAFLQAALESQADGLFRGAFEDVRAFFDKLYPVILANDLEMRQQDAAEKGEPYVEEEGILIVIPTPTQGVVARSPLEEEPRLITPGTRTIQ